MVKHSKKAGDRHHFSYHEKNTNDSLGTKTERLSTDSQLPFGYCSLSLYPTDADAVVSPSGHIYSREAILEYLLSKMKEIKEQQQQYEQQLLDEKLQEQKQIDDEKLGKLKEFAEQQDGGVYILAKRKSNDIDNEDYLAARKKIIANDKSKEENIEELKRVSPWLAEATPSAEPSKVKIPPKRPSSPFSGQPLRTKDLIPIDLLKEDVTNGNDSSLVRYLCPISKKTITSQKVVLIKSTGAYMLEECFTSIAAKSMICPLTNKKFSKEDIIQLVKPATSFASSGVVESKKYQHHMN